MSVLPLLSFSRRLAAALVIGLVPLLCLAQSHPRLLFDAADIPGLRAKILNEPYASMYADLLALKDAEDDTQYGPSYPAVRHAFLYVLTGDTTYATASLGYVDQVLINPNWALDSYKSLGRAMLGKGVALAYDFCYDAWSPADRDRVSLALKANADSLMRSGGSGWPGDDATSNNWHGVRYSGALLCFLSSDEAVSQSDIDGAYGKLRTHLQAKYGTGPEARGWDVEGIGYVRYPWGSFIGAAGIVLQRLEGIDMIAEAPGAGYALWATWPGTLPLPTYSTFLDRSILGLHPDFSDDNPNFQGEGSHGLSFYYAPPGFAAGIKWMYDRIPGALGDQTWDNYRHGTIYSILYYPDDATLPAQNPATIPGWGLNYEDERHGMLLFRDRYTDADDLVTQFNAKQFRPKNTHAGADINGFRIFGLGSAWTTGSGRTGKMGGQTTVFKSEPGTSNGDSGILGELQSYYYEGDGGGFADIAGSSTGVAGHVRRLVTDYSQASGARGVWLVSDRTTDGALWRLNTPGMNTIATYPGGFTLTAPNGNQMEGTILHPAGATPTTGTFTRGSSFTFDTVSYTDNNYLQIPGTDGDFLVVLTVVESGGTAPAVTGLGGSGMDRSFMVGPETFVLDGKGLLVSGWTGDELAPYAGIDHPVDNQYVTAGSDLLIQARAGDLDGSVSEVRFYHGETLLGTDTVPPYVYLWRDIPAADATQVTVVALDDDGNESIPTAVSFKPVITRDARSRIEAEDYDSNNGFKDIGGVIGYLNKKGWTGYEAIDFGTGNPTTVTVYGSVVNGGSCDFRLDSTSGPIIATVTFSGSGPFVATVDSSADVTGIRDLFFTHRSGGPGVANVDAFEFSGSTNAAPQVALDGPPDGSAHPAGADVVLTATATDTGGSVTQVEFFADGESVGIDTTPGDGWSVVWNTALAGTYHLSAEATDNEGVVTASGFVTVTREAPAAPPTPQLRATVDGSNLVVHFPTVSGVSYRVRFGHDIENMAGWDEFTTVVGDGAEAHVPIPMPPDEVQGFAHVEVLP